MESLYLICWNHYDPSRDGYPNSFAHVLQDDTFPHNVKDPCHGNDRGLLYWIGKKLIRRKNGIGKCRFSNPIWSWIFKRWKRDMFCNVPIWIWFGYALVPSYAFCHVTSVVIWWENGKWEWSPAIIRQTLLSFWILVGVSTMYLPEGWRNFPRKISKKAFNALMEFGLLRLFT